MLSLRDSSTEKQHNGFLIFDRRKLYPIWLVGHGCEPYLQSFLIKFVCTSYTYLLPANQKLRDRREHASEPIKRRQCQTGPISSTISSCNCISSYQHHLLSTIFHPKRMERAGKSHGSASSLVPNFFSIWLVEQSSWNIIMTRGEARWEENRGNLVGSIFY